MGKRNENEKRNFVRFNKSRYGGKAQPQIDPKRDFDWWGGRREEEKGTYSIVNRNGPGGSEKGKKGYQNQPV